MDRHPAAAQAMVSDGHEIASHGYRWIDYSVFFFEYQFYCVAKQKTYRKKEPQEKNIKKNLIFAKFFFQK